MEREKSTTKITVPGKDLFQNWWRNQKISEKQKLRELKNIHTETNNTITEIKNTTEGINSRISEAEEWINELEDKMVDITSEE